MCLALIALDAHPRVPLLIAANRDEFHARAAAPAHWWADGALAGVDLEAGGTWFGVTRPGRWALVTNYREGVPRDPNAPSRGGLVTRALAESTPPLACAASIAADGAPWPKVVHAKQRLAECLAPDSVDIESLFDLLADRTQAEPAALPATGIAPEWERLLSSAFIVDERYGTRCSTVLTIANDGSVRFVERSFDAEGRMTGEAAHEFALGAA